jgi:hypothetical protein
MSVSIHQLLGAQRVTRAISRIKTPLSRFQTWMGVQPGGPFSSDQGGDKFGYDVMDRTRMLAMGRPPGTGPATRAPNILGHITVSAYRAHEKMILLESRIFRTRPLGGQYGDVDTRGQQYVTKQEEFMSQLFRNNREFMVSRALRGKFDVKISGDNWVPVDTGSGHFSVDFKIPAGNKTQLDMLGAGSIIDATWANAATNIPLHCLKINAAFEQLHGIPLRHIWINSTGLNNVMNNTKMQALAGTANRVFESFVPTGIVGPDGIEDTGFTVRFNALPWLTWHVYDGGLDVDGTFTKFIGDTHAIFLPDPSSTIWEWYNGSEVVKENVMAPGDERYGLQAWVTSVIDPAGFELKGLDIGMIVPYIPKAIGFGTVVF